MAEWLKAADCKSAHVSVRRFESFSAHQFLEKELRDVVALFLLLGQVVLVFWVYR